jgi:phage baseplate assembly protein V
MTPEAWTEEPSVGRPLAGAAVGIVIDNRDPQLLGRVRVKLPTFSAQEIGHWARVAVPMAGNGRGTFFLPEVNDEVLVAFEGGDITRPYVVGALWNGVDQPPLNNADGQNNLRVVRSRSGHVIRLDDTPGAEKIEIVDKSGGNSVVIATATNAVTVKSAGNITLSAPQGTIKLSARSVEITTSTGTKVQAQGGVTLDGSPGTTTVKGSVVNIN